MSTFEKVRDVTAEQLGVKADEVKSEAKFVEEFECMTSKPDGDESRPLAQRGWLCRGKFGRAMRRALWK